jgi:hypothetical protein
MKEQEDINVVQVQNNVPAKPARKKFEISEESKENRQLLAGMLLQQTEDLVEKDLNRKKKRAEEVIELQSGFKITIGEINAAITANLQPYAPMFSNDIPFFSEIYRLNGWKDKDPKAYVKPTQVGTWINEIIYSRFAKDVLPALKVLNPASPLGMRKHKHFQYLTEEGRAKLIQFRDEAIEVMNNHSTWIGFRKELLQKYGVPYQASMFEESV